MKEGEFRNKLQCEREKMIAGTRKCSVLGEVQFIHSRSETNLNMGGVRAVGNLDNGTWVVVMALSVQLLSSNSVAVSTSQDFDDSATITAFWGKKENTVVHHTSSESGGNPPPKTHPAVIKRSLNIKQEQTFNFISYMRRQICIEICILEKKKKKKRHKLYVTLTLSKPIAHSLSILRV